jgi:hypothetical protein
MSQFPDYSPDFMSQQIPSVSSQPPQAGQEAGSYPTFGGIAYGQEPQQAPPQPPPKTSSPWPWIIAGAAVVGAWWWTSKKEKEFAKNEDVVDTTGEEVAADADPEDPEDPEDEDEDEEPAEDEDV